LLRCSSSRFQLLRLHTSTSEGVAKRKLALSTVEASEEVAGEASEEVAGEASEEVAGEASEEVDVELREEVDTEAGPIRVDTKLDILETEAELETKSRIHNLADCCLQIQKLISFKALTENKKADMLISR
jgi:hypothetical protein